MRRGRGAVGSRTAAGRLAAFALALAGLAPGAAAASGDAFRPPEIVVLGDSQISFGAGEAFTEFFADLASSCGAGLGRRLAGARVGALGVRSTAPHSWTARSGRAKGMVCDKDPSWGVNAGTYGVFRSERRGEYEQIGEQDSHRFCIPGRSPFEAMFAPGYYAPKLLVLHFLGNAGPRWVDAPETAAADVAALTAQIPEATACVFMTTAPSYKPGVNAYRARGQAAILDAFAAGGGRCATVAGITPETRAAMEGQARYYRRRAGGGVIDPYHPLRPGADAWLALRRDAVCGAVGAALARADRVAAAGAGDAAAAQRALLEDADLAFAGLPSPRALALAAAGRGEGPGDAAAAQLAGLARALAEAESRIPQTRTPRPQAPRVAAASSAVRTAVVQSRRAPRALAERSDDPKAEPAAVARPSAASGPGADVVLAAPPVRAAPQPASERSVRSRFERGESWE